MRADRGPKPARVGARRAGLRSYALLAALVGVLAISVPATASAGAPSAGSALSLWGASFPAPAPWGWGPIHAFDRMLGKPVSVVGFGAPFANCPTARCSYYAFPKAVMSKIRRRGAIPFLSWSSQSTPARIYEPAFTLGQVLSGRYDSFIRRFARGAARWGHPFMLRFDWEMNGNWFPWGQRIGGNTTSQYVAVWQHVHQIFTSAGANNVSWVWCPNVGHWASLAKLYPGDAYVDWTCLDGYNWGTRGRHSAGAKRGGFKSFNSIFRSAYRQIVGKIAPSKPMVIGEVGSNNHGGSEAKWIASMFHVLPTSYPQIHGLLWYQQSDSWSFALRPGTPSTRAFAAGVSNPLYAANAFCRLSGPLLPPAAAHATSACGG